MSLLALLCYHDASEPVIFLCSLSGGGNLRSKDVLSCFKVCWYEFRQVSKLRELCGTEQLIKQNMFSPMYSGRIWCWREQLSFFIYLIVTVIVMLLESMKTFVVDSSVDFFFSFPPLHLFLYRCCFLFVWAELNLLTADYSQAAFLFVCQNF